MSRDNRVDLRNAQRLIDQAAGAKSEKWFTDLDLPYFTMRVYSTGEASWFFRKMRDGKMVVLRLGGFKDLPQADARQMAFQLATDWARGVHPKEQIAKAAAWSYSMEECFMEYHGDYAVHNCKTEAEMLKDLKRYWYQEFDASTVKQKKQMRRMADITPAELTPGLVQKWLNHLRTNSGPDTANKQLSHLRRAYQYCAEKGLFESKSDPFKNVTKFPEAKRNRYLTAEETQRFMAALRNHPGTVADCIEIGLYVGQRRQVYRSMEWNEINFTERTWTVPANKLKTSRTRNGQPQVVALSKFAMAILERRRLNREPGEKYVFPSGVKGGGHIKNLHKTLALVLAEAGIEDFRLHDLRHTYGTWLLRNNAPDFIIQSGLGHASSDTTKRYAHSQVEHIREELDAAFLKHLPDLGDSLNA